MITFTEYATLCDTIRYANNAYYKKSNPIMSDKQYDDIMNSIIEWETMNPDKILTTSPTNSVGDDLISENVLQHSIPMLSLANTYDKNDVVDWEASIDKIINKNRFNGFVVEEKLDGCSGSFTFVNGELVKALTRGNGIAGEDITNNMKLLDWSIDKNFTGEVRGEILMTKEEFNRLNVNGDYANPRNLVSGTIKLLDPNEFIKRKLIVKMYWFFGSNELSQYDTLKYLKELGFDVPNYKYCSNIDTTLDALNYFETHQYDSDVMIDGAVIKVNNINIWDSLGTTNKYPRYARAYKFKQEEAETKVLSIEFQVGRTGKITPCCNFEPVTIDGSTISRCTLNNIDYMTNLDPRVGDTIIVHKAAAIIPEIVSVDLSKRPEGAERVEFVKTCPICGSVLLKEPDKADHFCPNIECEARVQESINHFCHSMEIDGFGPELISKFYEYNVVKSIHDIYEIPKMTSFPTIEGIGDKTFNNLIEQINKSKTNSPDMLLLAIGIPGVGKKIAKQLISKFKTINNLMNATFNDIITIEGFGEIKASNIITFMSNTKNIDLLNKLAADGLNFGTDSNTIQASNNSILYSKTFVVTGALSIKRDAFEQIVYENGGKLAGSVSAKTYALITNTPDSGSSKNKKARELGVLVITENEFYKMIEGD